jgi:hypothetical protein
MSDCGLYQYILIGQGCAIDVWFGWRVLGMLFNHLLREACD